MPNTYGSSQYGLNTYGTTTELSQEELEKYYIDLGIYVPDFISLIEEMKEIYEVEGEELGLIQYQIVDIYKQFRIKTATWGLVLWEKRYGIETNLSLTYEERREIIEAKRRGRGTTTIQMIKNTAESFSGGEVDVIEHNEHYYFVVKFVGVRGIPKNMPAFIDMIETIKPAHLGYKFEYTYLTWGALNRKKFSIAELRNYKLSEIKVMDGD